VAALEGRRDDAVTGYHEAFRLVRQLEVPAILADHLVDAVTVLGPDDPETPGFATEARALYERAGARAQLDRLDEALRPAKRPERPASGVAERARVGGAGPVEAA
jgi:hypothetical protein